MLDTKKIEKIVFLDIETTSQYASFKSMPEKRQVLFKRRFKKEFEEIDEKMPSDAVDYAYEEIYSTKAPLFAEFGRILCISCGVVREEADEYTMKIVSYSDNDEVALLTRFLKGMDKVLSQPLVNPDYAFCAHNGMIFDFPYIAKRLIINRMTLPKMLDYTDRKPWEISYLIDTKAVWKYNVYDHNTSLDLLCDIFDVPSSKDDIDGSQVKDVYWKEQDLARITKYCEKDVHSLGLCYLRMKGIFKNITVK